MDSGFHIQFTIPTELATDERNRLVDAFILQAIETNELQFGGGGPAHEWSGFAESGNESNDIVTESQRHAVIEWLRTHPPILQYSVSSLIDLDNDEQFQPYLDG